MNRFSILTLIQMEIIFYKLFASGNDYLQTRYLSYWNVRIYFYPKFLCPKGCSTSWLRKVPIRNMSQICNICTSLRIFLLLENCSNVSLCLNVSFHIRDLNLNRDYRFIRTTYTQGLTTLTHERNLGVGRHLSYIFIQMRSTFMLMVLIA